MSFAPRHGSTKSVSMNLVLDSTKSIGEEIKSILDILPLPLHVRIGMIRVSMNKMTFFKISGQYATVVLEIVFLSFILVSIHVLTNEYFCLHFTIRMK